VRCVTPPGDIVDAAALEARSSPGNASRPACVLPRATSGSVVGAFGRPRHLRATPGYNRGMTLYLFAGIPVDDFAAALGWYQRLFGSPPTFFPNDTEAVWELAEQRSVYVEHRPEHAGHAMHTILVDDLDARVAQIAERGLEPAKRETYDNGVRKITYYDPDGNEFGFGDAP
jgi:predicted enzyme related to lactoylglutathione lyase